MRIACITGASAGIGLATAGAFEEAGWSVINLSRRACPNDSVTSIPCDLASLDDVSRAGAEVAARLADAERVTVVHNAAALYKDSVREPEPARLRAALDVSVVGPSALNEALLPSMPAGSSILYVGSTLAEQAVPGAFSYVTTKHAVVGMMRATCQDLAGSGVHTACICPGFTETEMLRAHVGGDAEVLDAIGGMSAFGRLIDPREIADTLLWAANHPVINGAVIHANLGQLQR